MFKKKSLLEKIDDYLGKKSHEKVLTLLFKDYNRNDIYVRFDYVREIGVYKIVWIDLKFFDVKKMDQYINMQTVTSYLSTKIVEVLDRSTYESGNYYNEKFIGDRVEIVSYQKSDPYYFYFDRFLPLEWKFLVDPLVIIFSYLPRSMECFLNEMFAKLDGVEDIYIFSKPYKFDIFNGDMSELFKPIIINRAKKYVAEGKVAFLEKVRDKYIAIVEGTYPYLVIIHMYDKEHVILWCNCKCEGQCKHIAAVLLAIREKKFNNFYKVRNLEETPTLLDKVADAAFNLCFGVSDDNLLLVSNDGGIITAPILKNGKCMFEVLEDDDELSLSKVIDSYKK